MSVLSEFVSDKLTTLTSCAPCLACSRKMPERTSPTKRGVREAATIDDEKSEGFCTTLPSCSSGGFSLLCIAYGASALLLWPDVRDPQVPSCFCIENDEQRCALFLDLNP